MERRAVGWMVTEGARLKVVSTKSEGDWVRSADSTILDQRRGLNGRPMKAVPRSFCLEDQTSQVRGKDSTRINCRITAGKFRTKSCLLPTMPSEETKVRLVQKL